MKMFRTKGKQSLTIILSLLLLFTMIPGSLPGSFAYADEYIASGTCGNSLTWTLDSEGLLNISGEGSMKYWISSDDVPWAAYRDEIKTAVIDNGVTTIGGRAFIDCIRLTSISIPGSVTEIGANSFEDCRSLKSIEISEEVTWIGRQAFGSCSSLTSIEIPGSVTVIPPYAFTSCLGLTSIIFHEGVTEIGSYVFENCYNLERITIPESVTSIGEKAFEDVKGVFYVKKGSYADEYLTSLGKTVVYITASGECGNNLTWTLDSEGLLTISGEGEMKYWISSNDVPWVPYRDEIKTVVIDSGVISIGHHAFTNCSSLESITVPDGVTTIGESAFSRCSSLTSITIPESVTSIGDYAFYGCSSFTSITIPEGVTSIGDDTFDGCSSLTSITIPESVTSIGEYAFNKCSSLTSITIPESVTSIEDFTFSKCSSLTSIMIPEGVTSIGLNAFKDCSSLTSISIPDVVTYIGDSAFENCTSLETVLIPESVTTIGQNVFANINEQASLYVIEGSYADTFIKNKDYSGMLKYVTKDGDHYWYEETTTEPGCETPGTKTVTCVKCGEIRTEEITALGHVWSEWAVTKTATCIVAGEEKRVCSRCDEEQIRELEPLGHKEEIISAVEPTCTETGLTEGKKCSVCNETLVAQEVVQALGHDYADTVTAPTCEEQGYTTHTCSRCGDSYVDSYVTALGHDWGEWTVVKEATETEEGLERRVCANDPTHIEERAIPVISHVHVLVKTDAVAATCTEDGNIVYWTCSGCGKYFSDDEGLNEITPEDTVIRAKGHTEEVLAAVEPTCTEAGLTEGKKCSVCGETLVAQEVVPALGHDYVETVTAPTCEEQGYTTHTCSRCGDSYVDSYVTALGHEWGEWTVVKEATETEEGLERRVCKNDPTHIEERAIPVISHVHVLVKTDAVAATCTEDGNIVYWTCSGCGKYFSDAEGLTEITLEDTVVKASGHKEVIIPAVEPTCTETGLTEGKKCSACGETLLAQEVVPALGHDYISTVTAPTCETQGYTTHTCSRCQDSYTDSYVDALGHSWGEWTVVKEATETEEGLERRVCANDPTHIEERAIEKLEPVEPVKTGWVKEDGVWYYYKDDGTAATGWQKISGKWYYMDSTGAMQTGWKKIGSKWYYFNSSGVMQTGWKKIGSKQYFFKSSGAMAANEWVKGYYWINKDGTWTYKYKASWKKSGSKWWFGDTSGWYAKNTTITIDGKKYTFDKKGYMV